VAARARSSSVVSAEAVVSPPSSLSWPAPGAAFSTRAKKGFGREAERRRHPSEAAPEAYSRTLAREVSKGVSTEASADDAAPARSAAAPRAAASPGPA